MKNVLILSGSPRRGGNSDILWTEVKNKEFYYIITCADGEKQSVMTTLACLRGYADCVSAAVERGVIYGTGVYQKGEIKTSPAMKQAYEMGRSV